MEQDHFYEPAKGHGLKHDPFNAIVGPRPIGWISSRGADGSVNLAPYSFFNAFCYHPPIIGFSSIGAKDTLRNVRETGEFVWNLATRELAEAMNATSATAAYGVDEFTLAGLEKAPANLVQPPRVAASPVNFECKVAEIVQLKGWQGQPAEAWLVLGEVVGVHIAPHLIVDGVFDTFSARILLRAGGATAYAEVLPETRLDMKRPG
ncbi:flavin reductase family protein [Acidocella aromatica]|uniref:Flavin reductase (DIM6/NTAB) family NADH-FMN oxidoreductase RutF n=1 Tax=Acidocella aromatica TaxID=1303579 RepID=A0A840VA81_9PROT|nr:flavin reductase family protein [Acidocella aromatica]MBB5372626.1 flavin reductase (DIM6/NTAB) family NADH-FMN oxidoreductase RutF [Acidocella aromatica]